MFVPVNPTDDPFRDQSDEPGATDPFAADLAAWPPSLASPAGRDTAPADLDANPRFRSLRGFRSRHLPGERQISLYLPEAYLHHPERRFPVLYMADGQNLFDPRRSFVPGHTWQAHHAVDSLTAAGRIEPLILVGIDHAGTRRMAEYTPTPDPRQGGGEAPLYARMLIEEILPLIDRHLRTLPGAAHTGIAGSSLGGLVSLWLGLSFPQHFGRVAALSPSLWWNDGALIDSITAATALRPRDFSAPHGRPLRPRIWLDIGSAEGDRNVRDAERLCRRLLAAGWTASPAPATPPAGDGLLHFRTVPAAQHNEDAWAARLPDVLGFLFPPQP